VAVIWALIFFAVLSVGIARVVSSQARLVQKLEGWVLAEFAMHSACQHIRQELAAREEPYWSQADLRRERTLEFGVARVQYYFVDEESRININTAPQDILARIPGIGEDMAAKIAASQLRPFFVEEALLWIEDLDETSFEKARALVTVHSNGRVNLNTASPAVLQALGLDLSLAESIDTVRKGGDGVNATADDRIFRDAGSVETVLGVFAGLSEESKGLILDLFNTGVLGVDSDNFTVKASVSVLGKKVMDYDILLNANRVVRWQEY
jgi:type II secretory pathway component PulK